MRRFEFDLLCHTCCYWHKNFEEILEPIDSSEDLITDFKCVYYFDDFASVLWARQYLLLTYEPFQVTVDSRDGGFVILCNLPWG